MIMTRRRFFIFLTAFFYFNFVPSLTTDLFLRRTSYSFLIEEKHRVTKLRSNEKLLNVTLYEIPGSVHLFEGKLNVTTPVAQIRSTGDLIERGGATVSGGRIYFPICGYYFIFFSQQSQAFLDNVRLKTWRGANYDVVFACAGQRLSVSSPSRGSNDIIIGSVFLQSSNESTDCVSHCAKRNIKIQKRTVIKAMKRCNFPYKFAVTNDKYWSDLGYPSFGTNDVFSIKLMLNFFKSGVFSNESFAVDARKGLFNVVDWCKSDRLNMSLRYKCVDQDWIIETVCEVLSEHTTNYLQQMARLSTGNWLRGFSQYLSEHVRNVTRQIPERIQSSERLLAWLIYFQYNIVYCQSKVYTTT